jgi:putative toxin-antitoxin system antitoxin component (TIGR02293 family)
MVLYTPRVEHETSVLHVLGLTTSSTQGLIHAVKEGLPVRTFTLLAAMLGISEAALAGVTGISSSTLTRRKRSGQLTPEESEHVLRIARLLDLAIQVFEDADSAADWLRSDNPSLGGQAPLAYADTEIGAREVENLLGRIAYGVYS